MPLRSDANVQTLAHCRNGMGGMRPAEQRLPTISAKSPEAKGHTHADTVCDSMPDSFLSDSGKERKKDAIFKSFGHVACDVGFRCGCKCARFRAGRWRAASDAAVR